MWHADQPAWGCADREGWGVRVCPGGVLPDGLVITGAGLVPAEDEPDEDGDGEALGRGEGLRPRDGTGDGGGTVTGPGTG